MEHVSVSPQERVWRQPRVIRDPIVLWLGSHPLITYPGLQEGQLSVSFADAAGGKEHRTETGSPVTIGRFSHNTLTFGEDLDMISRNHAQITRQGKIWQVQDLGSTNGTFVEEIYTCPPGEKLLPKHAWHLIPDGRQHTITFSTVHRSNLTKDDELPFLTLSTLPDMGIAVLQDPLLEERPPFILPLHQPISIGSSLDSDLSFSNNQYLFAPQHATVINTGNGVLIRDNHATGVTKVKVAKR